MFVFKRDSNSGVSCGYCEIFKNSFFIKNLWWLLLKVLPQYSKVGCGICSLNCAFTCFWIWLKIYTKHCTNNSLLSSDKTISFLLELIYHVLSISECSGKILVAFDFDGKLTKSVAQITMCWIAQKINIMCEKLSSSALCGWSIRGHDLEHGSKNIEIKIWQ